MFPNAATRSTDGRGRSTVSWVIAALLAVIAVTLIVRPDPIWSSNVALGQGVGARPYAKVGAMGVYLYPAQISRDRYGLVMLDVDADTIWVYEFAESKTGGKRVTRLNLIAARTWLYDRELKELNTNETSLSVDDVKIIVDQQKRLRGEGGNLAEENPRGQGTGG